MTSLLAGLGQAEGVEQLGRRAPWPALLLEPEQPGEQDQVLAAGQVLVDRGELAREADRAADRVGLGDHVVPEDLGLARVGLEQRGEHADRGGLAGAVGAEHAVDRAATNGEIDAVDGLGVAEGLDEAGDFDGEWGGGWHGRSIVGVQVGVRSRGLSVLSRASGGALPLTAEAEASVALDPALLLGVDDAAVHREVPELRRVPCLSGAHLLAKVRRALLQ